MSGEGMICCPLSGNDDADACQAHYQTLRTARKEHQCCECRDPIAKGDRYEYVSGIWDRQPLVYKTCLLCVEIRNHFACESGWIYEQLWEDLRENFFPEMKAGGPCMEGLSPAAKARLFERRLTWLGVA